MKGLRSPRQPPIGRPRIRWAPRLDPRRLRRLYAQEARGVAPAALIDDVGLALLLRCESILLVSAGKVRCPACEPERTTDYALRPPAGGPSPDAAQRCPRAGCDWGVTWREYHASWSKRHLFGGKAVTAFRTFAESFPRTREPRRRLLLIDQLLHSFHWDLRAGAPNRLAANNLVEGSHSQVLALLDELNGEWPADQRYRWRQDVARMLQRRGAVPEPRPGDEGAR